MTKVPIHGLSTESDKDLENTKKSYLIIETL